MKHDKRQDYVMKLDLVNADLALHAEESTIQNQRSPVGFSLNGKKGEKNPKFRGK